MHARLGHICTNFLKKTSELEAAYGLEKLKLDDSNCEVCIQAKVTKQSYKSVEKTDKEQYETDECIHADLVHSPDESTQGCRCFLLIKDEASSYRQVYFQKKKTETLKNVEDAINFISNQTGNHVKTLRYDN